MPFRSPGLRIGAAVSTVGTVIAELTMAQSGLGGLLATAGNRFQMDKYFAVVIVLMVLGTLITIALRFAERRLALARRAQRGALMVDAAAAPLIALDRVGKSFRMARCAPWTMSRSASVRVNSSARRPIRLRQDDPVAPHERAADARTAAASGRRQAAPAGAGSRHGLPVGPADALAQRLGQYRVALALRGYNRRESRDRAMALLGSVGLRDFAEAFPHEFSGGMQQRVGSPGAGGRAARSVDGRTFAALDAMTREVLRNELLQMWSRDAWPSSLSPMMSMKRCC